MKVTTAEICSMYCTLSEMYAGIGIRECAIFECVQLANVHISFQSLKTRLGKILPARKFHQFAEHSYELCYKTVRFVYKYGHIHYIARTYVNVRVLTYVYETYAYLV